MYSIEQLENLEEALTRGERRVTFEDKTVEYRTVEELKAAISEVSKVLRKSAIAKGRQKTIAKQIRVTTSKGF